MAFDLTAPYTPCTDMVCQQEGGYYLVRVDRPTGEGPVPYVSLGPYTSVEEALGHVVDLPPPPAPPPLIAESLL